MLTSEYPEPLHVFQSHSNVPIVPIDHDREKLPKGRVAAIDLRIGLSMLGQEGRKLLAEYITIKLQQEAQNTLHQ